MVGPSSSSGGASNNNKSNTPRAGAVSPVPGAASGGYEQPGTPGQAAAAASAAAAAAAAQQQDAALRFEDLTINDDLSPLDRVITYGRSNIALQRLVHARMLSEASEYSRDKMVPLNQSLVERITFWHEKIITIIVPIMQALSSDPESIIRSTVSLQILPLTKLMMEKSDGDDDAVASSLSTTATTNFGYNQIIMGCFVPVLTRLYRDDDKDVRNAASETIINLCIEKFLKEKDILQSVLPVIPIYSPNAGPISISTDVDIIEQTLTSLTTLMGLVPILPSLQKDHVMEIVWNYVQKGEWKIKRLILSLLPKCITSSSVLSSNTRVMDILNALSVDDSPRVRRVACEISPQLITSSLSDLEGIVAIIERLLLDVNRQVRGNMYQILGVCIASLSERRTANTTAVETINTTDNAHTSATTVVDILMPYFLSMLGSTSIGIVERTDDQIIGWAAFVREYDLRYHMCFTLPGILKFLYEIENDNNANGSGGDPWISGLRDAYYRLALGVSYNSSNNAGKSEGDNDEVQAQQQQQSQSIQVPQSSPGPLPHERKCLASSLHVVAGILRENCRSTGIGNSGSESNGRNTSAATAAVVINSGGVDDIIPVVEHMLSSSSNPTVPTNAATTPNSAISSLPMLPPDPELKLVLCNNISELLRHISMVHRLRLLSRILREFIGTTASTNLSGEVIKCSDWRVRLSFTSQLGNFLTLYPIQTLNLRFVPIIVNTLLYDPVSVVRESAYAIIGPLLGTFYYENVYTRANAEVAELSGGTDKGEEPHNLEDVRKWCHNLTSNILSHVVQMSQSNNFVHRQGFCYVVASVAHHTFGNGTNYLTTLDRNRKSDNSSSCSSTDNDKVNNNNILKKYEMLPQHLSNILENELIPHMLELRHDFVKNVRMVLLYTLRVIASEDVKGSEAVDSNDFSSVHTINSRIDNDNLISMRNSVMIELEEEIGMWDPLNSTNNGSNQQHLTRDFNRATNKPANNSSAISSQGVNGGNKVANAITSKNSNNARSQTKENIRSINSNSNLANGGGTESLGMASI